MPISQKQSEKPAKLLHPKTAMQFVRLWEIPGSDHLINGNADFPNIYARQDRLVGQVIDACIALHVYEQIKAHASYNSLKPLLSDNFSETQFDKLAKLPDNKQAPGGSELLKAIIELSQNKGKDKGLKTHSDLVSKKEWKSYIDEFREYEKKYIEWKVDAYSKKDAIEQSESPSYYTSVKNKKITINKAPERPEDPRVTRINKEIAQTITILDPGPKAKDSIEAKASNRGNAEITSFRDLNRIGVLPTETTHADDFITIIANLNPPKSVKQNQVPRFFEEQAEIFDHGYFNKKLFVALDRCKERDGGVTNGNIASIAEIKIVPAKMLDAEKLTAITKPLRDMLARPEIYISHSDTDVTPQVNRGKLKTDYETKKADFIRLSEKLGVQYKFPEFNIREPNNPGSYRDLRQEFNKLSTRIHVDAIKKENRTWQEEYLKTATIQDLAGSNEQYLDRINRKLSTNLPRTDKMEHSWLEEIAHSVNLDLKEITRKLREEFKLGKMTATSSRQR